MSKLKQFFYQTIKADQLSAADFIRLCGYKNTNKGLRRLDHYLNTLEEDRHFIEQFEAVFCFLYPQTRTGWHIARRQTKQALRQQAKKHFKPYIEVIPSATPSPLFMATLLHIKVAPDLPQQDRPRQLAALKSHFSHYLQQRSPEHSGWPKQFIYHKAYDEQWVFNAQMEEIARIGGQAEQTLTQKITRILYRIDIMNLGGHDNHDEYEPEAREIARALASIASEKKLQDFIFQCFGRWFYRCNPPVSNPCYQQAARQIWSLGN